MFDTLNAKAAIHAAPPASIRELPIMLSMTITDLSGRNLSGHSIESLLGLGPPRPAADDRAQLLVRRRRSCARISPRCRRIADTLIMAYPNAGLPNDLGEYDECPATTARPGPRMGRAGHRQHRRRLLRHHAGAYPRDRRDGARLSRRARIPTPQRRTRLAGIEPMILAA